jgi:hypothetical protein
MKRLVGLASAYLGIASAASGIDWDRAVYYDPRYPNAWVGSGRGMADFLAHDGYAVLDADALKSWMEARIASPTASVVVFSQDIAPDTVAETMSPDCTLRRYLDAGGKIVWYADIPLYYQGHADGSRTDWGGAGAAAVLGFVADGAPWDSNIEVSITADGFQWGLSETWASIRPTHPGGLRILAGDGRGYASAWVRHFVPGDTYRGFVRTFDRPGVPNVDDVRRLAVYPDTVAPLLGDRPTEIDDDIVAAFHYPWYGNPGTSGRWVHWQDATHAPPRTWSANFAPDYPDSTWNPAVMLYDSNNTALLRWQDRLMARAGLDLAICSWWGRNTYEDAALARAIRICKSLQWCIYYEQEGYTNPSVSQIVTDIRWIVDRLGPTRNYAKVDGKWLIFVYTAYDEDAASRWRQAKQQLRASGYDVYINAAGSASPQNHPDPWDAIHIYDPTSRRTATRTAITGDDSASVSPGFWLIEQEPWLSRDLNAFRAGWEQLGAEVQRSRFLLIETWNEWHEGTSIEPGQRVFHDHQNGFTPSGDDYGLAFVDAVSERANSWHWRTGGARPGVPAIVQAERMVWEQGSRADGADAWRIVNNGARIGGSVQLPFGVPCDVRIAVRVRGARVGLQAGWPDMVLYWAGEPLTAWTVASQVYTIYEHSFSTLGGVYGFEVSLANDPGGVSHNVDLVVDYVEIRLSGDFDDNGRIDGADLGPLWDCMNGPGRQPEPVPPATAEQCLRSFDFDRDSDVDLLNFAGVQRTFHGSGGG